MPEYREIKQLENVLRAKVGDVEVLRQDSQMLTAPGENYGSIITALTVEIRDKATDERKTLHLVAKFIPASEILRAMFEIEKTFRKEASAYTVIIPALVDFLRTNNLDADKFKSIFVDYFGGRFNLQGDKVDDDAVMLFENLKVQGYAMADRLTGFNYDEAKIVLKDLAAFHAVPLALRLKDPKKFQELLPVLTRFGGSDNMDRSMENQFLDTIRNTLKQYEKFTKYMDKINKLIDLGIEEFKSPPTITSKFATLQHCDLWVNNTMQLKDASGKLISNKILDLQIMTYDSGVRDVVFLLFTSIQSSVLDEHFNDLLKFYYDDFIAILKTLSVDTSDYDWNSFEAEFKECAAKEFQHIMFMLTPIFQEKGAIKSMETFNKDDMNTKPTQRYCDKLEHVIDSYIKYNLF